MTRRPDTPAVMGLIGLAALIVVGWIVLTALDKPVDREAWLAFGMITGGILGWIGKTLLGEAATPEVIPEPEPAVRLTPMGNPVPKP